MSKKRDAEIDAELAAIEDEIEELDDELSDDQAIGDNDYGFILGPDGELKSLFMPTEYFEIPENVLAIFKIFGIDHPEDSLIHQIH